MKQISRNYAINEHFFSGKIPGETGFLPDPAHECPIFSEYALISPDECRSMVDNMTKGASGDQARTGVGIRRSKMFPLTISDWFTYTQAFSTVRPKIERYFNAGLTNASGAHGLAYEPGDRYDMHCDNCDPVLDSNGKVVRFRQTMPHRQISTLLFLSDSVKEITQPLQCIGGNLSFPFILDRHNNKLVVEPRAGLFIAFPSNPFFVHEVHEVLEGFRMVIVDWHSARFHQHEQQNCWRSEFY